MIIFPILCTVISLLCAVVLARDAQRRPRPDKIVWSIAFLAFAVASGADAAGRAIEWTSWLARFYYITGPALVVIYLAIGELYLLAPKRMARFGVGGTLLLTAFWAAMVLSAPIDETRLAEDGWEAIERGTVMVVVTIILNTVGTAIIVGGTGYSVWNFWRKGIMRNRMIGCALICVGTFVVAAGGTLTRLGHYEYLYIAMSVGVALIFAGVLWTRRPDVVTIAPIVTSQEPPVIGAPSAPAAPVGAVATSTGLTYIEEILLVATDDELDRLLTEWSIPREAGLAFTRTEARAAWRLRMQLSAEGQRRFDAHGVPARRQILGFAEQIVADDPVGVRASSEATGPRPVSLADSTLAAEEIDDWASTYA